MCNSADEVYVVKMHCAPISPICLQAQFSLLVTLNLVIYFLHNPV